MSILKTRNHDGKIVTKGAHQRLSEILRKSAGMPSEVYLYAFAPGIDQKSYKSLTIELSDILIQSEEDLQNSRSVVFFTTYPRQYSMCSLHPNNKNSICSTPYRIALSLALSLTYGGFEVFAPKEKYAPDPKIDPLSIQYKSYLFSRTPINIKEKDKFELSSFDPMNEEWEIPVIQVPSLFSVKN